MKFWHLVSLDSIKTILLTYGGCKLLRSDMPRNWQQAQFSWNIYWSFKSLWYYKSSNSSSEVVYVWSERMHACLVHVLLKQWASLRYPKRWRLFSSPKQHWCTTGLNTRSSPLLIYINDIWTASLDAQFYLSADDTTVLFQTKKIDFCAWTGSARILTHWWMTKFKQAIPQYE